MKSMTGFAKRQCEINGHKVTIEIKTLNSKTLDANVKVPARFRAHELDIRSMLNRLERGKMDVILTDEVEAAEGASLNHEAFSKRYSELTQLAQELNCADARVFESIIAQSDVWNHATAEDITDEEWHVIAQTVSQAIDQVDAFRKQEGDVLEQDFVKHVNLIEEKMLAIPAYESERIEIAKDRIKKYFAESAIKEMDQNRFEQELIYYFEKLDITEEKVRLAKHIDYFRQTMAEEESCGKKLGFIAQEMGREINTTGSKANHVEIQKLVVQMKDELEKIKEQLGNIL